MHNVDVDCHAVVDDTREFGSEVQQRCCGPMGAILTGRGLILRTLA
jgi:hypothetical protein